MQQFWGYCYLRNELQTGDQATSCYKCLMMKEVGTLQHEYSEAIETETFHCNSLLPYNTQEVTLLLVSVLHNHGEQTHRCKTFSLSELSSMHDLNTCRVEAERLG